MTETIETTAGVRCIYFIRPWKYRRVSYASKRYYAPPDDVIEAALADGVAVHEGAEPPEPDPQAEMGERNRLRRAELAAVEAKRAARSELAETNEARRARYIEQEHTALAAIHAAALERKKARAAARVLETQPPDFDAGERNRARRAELAAVEAKRAEVGRLSSGEANVVRRARALATETEKAEAAEALRKAEIAAKSPDAALLREAETDG